MIISIAKIEANCFCPAVYKAITAKENITNSSMKWKAPFKGIVAFGEPKSAQIKAIIIGTPMPRHIFKNHPLPVCIPQYPSAINRQISNKKRRAKFNSSMCGPPRVYFKLFAVNVFS